MTDREQWEILVGPNAKNWTDEQLRDAEDALREYLDVALLIASRLSQEKDSKSN